jgi:hypothetical protein
MPYSVDFTRPLYYHQINKLRSPRTHELFESMQRDCLPLYTTLGLQLVGYWESAPGQGHFPETVEVWELKGYEHYREFIASGYSEKADSRLRDWFEKRSQWVETSESMLCLPHAASPTAAALRAKTKPKMIVHEIIRTQPSRQMDYLDALYKLWYRQVAEKGSRSVIGLYFPPWNNCTAVNIWGMKGDWNDLAVMGKGSDFQSELNELWMTLGLALRDDWNDRLLIPAPFSP